MIARITPSGKRIIATGRVRRGRVIIWTPVEHEMRGRSIFYAGLPRHRCVNDSQRAGWDEARHETEEADRQEREGFDAYLRCLEDENLPASWADPFAALCRQNDIDLDSLPV